MNHSNPSRTISQTHHYKPMYHPNYPARIKSYNTATNLCNPLLYTDNIAHIPVSYHIVHQVSVIKYKPPTQGKSHLRSERPLYYTNPENPGKVGKIGK